MKKSLALLWAALLAMAASAQPDIQVTEPGFRVFQFPRTQIPRIDGDFTDWDIVPDAYSVTIDEMWDDTGRHKSTDRSTLDVKVKVGWV